MLPFENIGEFIDNQKIFVFDGPFKDIKTNKKVKEKDLENVKTEKNKVRKEIDVEIYEPFDPTNVKPEENTAYQDKSNKVSIATVISRTYRYISGVPDYQQNDNPSMDNDCVPTAGANVIMYWNGKGYSNLSSSNNWLNVADRLGVIMNHTDDNGVLSGNIGSGMQTYVREKGYSKFSISRYSSPSFSTLETQIANGNPPLL